MTATTVTTDLNGHLPAAPSGSTGSAGAAALLERQWAQDERWAGIRRSYSGRGRRAAAWHRQEEHTLARRGAERLWRELHDQDLHRARWAR